MLPCRRSGTCTFLAIRPEFTQAEDVQIYNVRVSRMSVSLSPWSEAAAASIQKAYRELHSAEWISMMDLHEYDSEKTAARSLEFALLGHWAQVKYEQL